MEGRVSVAVDMICTSFHVVVSVRTSASRSYDNKKSPAVSGFCPVGLPLPEVPISAGLSEKAFRLGVVFLHEFTSDFDLVPPLG